MNSAYCPTSSSRWQPASAVPTTTRWSPTPTVKASGSGSAGRRRNSGIGSRKLTAREERKHSNPRLLECLATALLAVDHAERLDNARPGLDDTIARAEKGSTRGERVVDEHHPRPGAQRRSLDAAPRSVLLRLLAHDEAGDGAIRGAAERGHRAGDGISAEGEAADGVDRKLDAPLQRQSRHQIEAAAVERHLLAVDVVAAPAPAGEHEVPEAERARRHQRVQLRAKRSEILAHVAPLPGSSPGAAGCQRSTGWRAARTSSTRRTGVSCGAAWTKARSRSASSTMAAQTSASSSTL